MHPDVSSIWPQLNSHNRKKTLAQEPQPVRAGSYNEADNLQMFVLKYETVGVGETRGSDKKLLFCRVALMWFEAIKVDCQRLLVTLYDATQLIKVFHICKFVTTRVFSQNNIWSADKLQWHKCTRYTAVKSKIKSKLTFSKTSVITNETFYWNCCLDIIPCTCKSCRC